ncbi:MAG: magnesium/cobalt transporter CorA [Prolixibacteraceae bacterium]
MARFLRSRKKAQGAAPGSLIFLGNKKMETSELHLMVYNKHTVEEKQLYKVADIPENLPDGTVMWINVYGLQDIELIEKLGSRFSIPPLELEDILNPDQRPKLSENEENLTIFLKVLEYKNKIKRVAGDQISIVIGKNYVITFQEVVATYFNPVRQRIRAGGNGRIRQMGPDYLAYALIDTLVDGYIHNIESLGSEIESLEEEVLYETKKETLHHIYGLKTSVRLIRKNVRPLKEIMLFLVKNNTNLVNKKTITFFKDLQDLTDQATDAIDIYYNMTNDYLNIYHANVGNRTNDVMKVLTIFASIFIPLTFIAGIYGTNFDYLPELHYKYSYFIMWGVMIVIASVMLYFFRKKGFL